MDNISKHLIFNQTAIITWLALRRYGVQIMDFQFRFLQGITSHHYFFISLMSGLKHKGSHHFFTEKLHKPNLKNTCKILWLFHKEISHNLKYNIKKLNFFLYEMRDTPGSQLSHTSEPLQSKTDRSIPFDPSAFESLSCAC